MKSKISQFWKATIAPTLLVILFSSCVLGCSGGNSEPTSVKEDELKAYIDAHPEAKEAESHMSE